MERQIINKLIKWKEYPFRKPLILTGIRQVGKTWTLKEFGRLHYDNTAYFNFGENENYKQFFEGTKDIKRMLQNLMMASGQRIEPESTLVIFDEIQDSPQGLKALEYFCDNGKEYHIVCTGNFFKSDMAADSEMIPIDKVEILELYPMNFKEFLRANGDDNLAAFIENINILEPIAEAFYNPLLEKLKMYFITGGMPQSVLSWTQERDVPAMETALKNIIEGYESDFIKKAEGKDASKMLQIWQSIPLQLSKNNRKFTYKGVKEGARAREYEGALNCMADLGTVKRVYKVDEPEMPLSGKEISSSFKIYLPDVGILRKMYQMRFPDEDVSRLTTQQLRGREGSRVKEAYRRASKQWNIPWNGRVYDPNDFTSGDAVNQALSAGHACLYGLAHAVISALGCSPGLGFVHVGHECSFVYDVADLYKAEITIPIAFEIAAAAPDDLPGAVRRRVRDAMSSGRLLERMVRDIRVLILGDDAAEAAEETNIIYLWDERGGTVPNGLCYAPREEPAV